MLCDDLEGWDREDRREAQEGGDAGTCVCIWLIRFVVQQKLTQYCEAIITPIELCLKKKNPFTHSSFLLPSVLLAIPSHFLPQSTLL